MTEIQYKRLMVLFVAGSATQLRIATYMDYPYFQNETIAANMDCSSPPFTSQLGIHQ